MTCIVGYIDGGNIYMGCDCRVEHDWIQSTLPTKLFSVLDPGKMIIGVSGDVRWSNIIRYGLSFAPEQLDQSLDDKWMHTVFVEAVRKAASAAGYAIVIDSRESLGNNATLIGTQGRLYTLGGDLCLIPITRAYHAIGSGGMVAMGALFQMEHDRALVPEYRVWNYGPRTYSRAAILPAQIDELRQ